MLHVHAAGHTLAFSKGLRGSQNILHVHAAGHSLGGALATLAAYDMGKQLQKNKQSSANVVCYTFAAPRTGNHAFAQDYNTMVPDTWSVINDQVCLVVLLTLTLSLTCRADVQC